MKRFAFELPSASSKERMRRVPGEQLSAFLPVLHDALFGSESPKARRRTAKPTWDYVERHGDQQETSNNTTATGTAQQKLQERSGMHIGYIWGPL